MSFTNFNNKEIHCKIIYFGASGSGKTENLRSVYKNLAQELASGSWILDETSTKKKVPGSLEFLPISVGEFEGFHVKIHLYTIPEMMPSNLVKSVFFRGIDGYVFVADSAIEALGQNIDALREARSSLIEQGYDIADLPHLIQYNKRDQKDLVPISVLRKALNFSKVQDLEVVATQSVGTMESLRLLTQQIIGRLQARA